MKFISTRGKTAARNFSDTVKAGIAQDGGLYVPETLPIFKMSEMPSGENLADYAKVILKPFLSGDVLESKLNEICDEALNFSIPLKSLKNHTAVLELFHGPTSAFKDVGARFLAACISRLGKPGVTETVMVATSGDTGGAVAGAFFKKPNVEVNILFPKGRISLRQEKQLTAWGENIKAFAVSGTFDDCQALVKKILSAPQWQGRSLISANSINIGRLLPQMTYYAMASLQYQRKNSAAAGFIVPSGNLGNAVAAVMAMKMGFPIREIILATNANHAIVDYFQCGIWKAQPTIATLANAMDVGNPSNMERLQYFFPDFEDMKTKISTVLVKDAQIQDTIRNGLNEWGEIWCPHTATAVYAREIKGGDHWVVVSTAHPAKFETIIEPLIGHKVEVPKSLAAILKQESKVQEIEPTLEAFEAAALK